MQENLVIVESPAKAKTIEKFLGSDFKVMSSYGHIRDLKKRELSIDEKTMMPHYEIPEEKKPELKAQIKEHLEGLVGVVPGLIKAEVVTDLLPSSTRDLCLITELESAEALAAYAVNPNHVHVADTYVRPNVCDRVAMDFEV